MAEGESFQFCDEQYRQHQLNGLQESALTEALHILQVTQQILNSFDKDITLLHEMIKRLNDVLDEANQLAQLCESESGDLILESDQEIANLQMKIGSLQVSIRETREQLENLYTSEGHFTEAENQHLKELRSIESAIMQANEKIEKAKSHRKRCLWASVVLIPLVVISPVLLFTAMGPITAHIENYQKIKQTTQDSASRSQQKLQLVRLQLKQTVETAKELEGALQESMTKLELTEAKKVLWIQIQSRQKEIQLEFRQKCFMLGDMAAAGKLPLALVDTNCQLLDFIHEAIKPLVYQAASLQGAGLDEDIHSAHRQYPAIRPNSDTSDMNISICQNQNILSLPEVEVKYDMSQLLTCPAALLISIAQLSEAVDNSPDQPASPQIRQIQLQMRDSVWEALKDFTVHLNQVNRISEFLSKTLQTTGLRLQIQLKRMETPSELDWSEFDQSLAGLRSQSTLLDDSFTKIEDTFNHLFRSLNQLIEELLHDEHIGKEIKSNLLEGIKEIDGQMSLLKTRSAEREESIQRQRDVVNGLHKDFCARIAQLPDCELAAADFAIELAMDIVFYCVPFLKAVEFLDEALVLSRYFLRKGSQLISNVRSYIRNRGTNGASEENLAEARQQVNARTSLLITNVDAMWESWIDQNGRLRPFITETQIQSVRIPFELALKDSWLQKTVSCPQVDAFASQLVIGLIYCERLQNFCQNGDYDPTTPEASQLADDLIEFVKHVREFAEPANESENRKPQKVRFYHIFLNGICGFKAMHERYTQEVLQYAWRLDDDRLESQKLKLCIHQESLQLLAQQHHLATDKINNQEICTREIIEATRLMINLKQQIWQMMQKWRDTYGQVSMAAEQLNNIDMFDIIEGLSGRKLAFDQCVEAVTRLESIQSATKLFVGFCNQYYLPAAEKIGQKLEYLTILEELQAEVACAISTLNL